MTPIHPEHSEAGAELFAAAEHLELIEPGLGYALLDAVAEAISSIEEYPAGWPPVAGFAGEPVVRSKATRRFHKAVSLSSVLFRA